MNGINLRKQLEEDLTELKRMILRLGKMAEESVTRAVWALKNQDVEAARSVIEKDDDIDEEKLMEDALEAGAIDFLTDDGVYDIRTEPNDFSAICEDLEKKGYTFLSAEVEYVPSSYTRLENEDDIKNMSKMLEMFEDNDDVQNVWHNWENADDAE